MLKALPEDLRERAWPRAAPSGWAAPRKVAAWSLLASRALHLHDGHVFFVDGGMAM